MTNPITPPPELVQQWSSEAEEEHQPTVAHSMVSLLAAKAAQWGADQELEACCAWLPKMPPWSANDLRKHRRPKPPSLKEQALGALGRFSGNGHTRADEMAQDFDTIRRALGALPND
jgi:hypothetical protein